MSLHTSQKDVGHYQRAVRLVDGCCRSAKSWTGQGQAERSFLRLIGSDRDSASLHQAGLSSFWRNDHTEYRTYSLVRASPPDPFLLVIRPVHTRLAADLIQYRTLFANTHSSSSWSSHRQRSPVRPASFNTVRVSSLPVIQSTPDTSSGKVVMMVRRRRLPSTGGIDGCAVARVLVERVKRVQRQNKRRGKDATLEAKKRKISGQGMKTHQQRGYRQG